MIGIIVGIFVGLAFCFAFDMREHLSKREPRQVTEMKRAVYDYYNNADKNTTGIHTGIPCYTMRKTENGYEVVGVQELKRIR